jgi:uncharacterized protein (DUF58 family)
VSAALALSRWSRRGTALADAVVDRVLYRQKTDPAPLVLLQHRIYVLPTRRGWVILLTLALMLVTSMNYALSLGYALTFLVAGLFGASLVHVFRNLVRLQIEPSGAPRAFAGEPLAFSFRVTNLSRYPRHMIRLFTGPAEDVVPELPAGGSATTSVYCIPTTRGRRRLGRFTVITDFPLGLWRAWAVIRFDYEGIVYPKPEAAAPPLPAGGDRFLPSAARQLASLTHDTEIDGLRAYAPGDPPRSVAWKAVAKGHGWYSKRQVGASGPNLVLLGWTEAGPGLDDEARLARLTAWAVRAERNGIPFALEIPGTSIGPGQGHAHLDAVLSALGAFGGKRAE